MLKNVLTFKNIAIAGVIFMFACQEDMEDQLTPDVTTEAENTRSELIPNQYIVVFNTEKTGEAGARYADPVQARQYVADQTLRIIRSAVPGFTEKQIARVYSATINGASVRLSADRIERLRQDERIAYIEQDQIITMAPPRKGGGGGSTAEEKPYGITRVNGGITYTGSNVAWVIDTGIDLDHEDLKVDASRGFNAFTTGRDGKSLDDNNGHGSHVAGTIAAIDNAVGVIGVAAGATVIPVKVLNSNGSGSYSGVIAGVDHVGAKGKSGDVANMSLGGPVSQALDDAVKKASGSGIKFTLAAGNESDDANNHSPARANGTNIFTISAMDSKDVFASFSNYANPPVDYCAPGVSIKSTYKDGGYRTLSGTSMAAPHAAGVLLLGSAKSGGTVKNDPDGQADTIIVH